MGLSDDQLLYITIIPIIYYFLGNYFFVKLLQPPSLLSHIIALTKNIYISTTAATTRFPPFRNIWNNRGSRYTLLIHDDGNANISG